MTGQTISRYRILDKLGEGAMGVVYKAEDTKLLRFVALKFLPANDDVTLRERFLREAQAVAALNHPNICTIYEVDEEHGFLAMELVEGPSLKGKIAERPLKQEEALDIAGQICAGLKAAHEKGVVHRDIKPPNILLTPEGKVKITDFGLAALANRTRLTKTGTSMGTPAYMSPEQARGEMADRRTDIWSAGVVLYEMLTGRLPFAGEQEAAVLRAILDDDPEPVTALRSGLPVEMDRVVGKALAKDAGERYQHADDLLVDLRTLGGRLQLESRAERRAAARKRQTGQLAAALAGLFLGVAGVLGWVWSRAQSTAPPPVVRFSFDLPKGREFNPSWNPLLSISPDGRTVALSPRAAGTMAAATFLRRLDALEAQPLPDAPGLAQPLFSPDGRNLVVVHSASQTVRKMAATGGASVQFAASDFHFRGFWAADDYYYWTDGYFSPIIRTPLSGGKSEQVTHLDLERQERTHRHAQMLPGGNTITFTVSAGGMDSFDDARIVAYSLDSKKRKTLLEGGFSAKYSPSGHLVYARGGSLYAVPFDAKALAVTGSPVKAVEGVFMSTNTGSAYFDISRSGDLVYAVGKAEGGERNLVWVDRQGKADPLPLPVRSYLFPRLSPDGKLIAFEVEGVNHDLHVYDPDRGVTSKMSTDGVSHAPVWTPDGKHLAFRSWKAGTMTMWWMPSDRSGPEERLTTVGARQSLVSFSPDGRFAAFNQMELEPGKPMSSDVWMLPMQGDRQPQPFVKSKPMKGSGKFSTDGQWVAYCSMESGRAEVYVQPWPGPGPKIQVSSEGGTDPIWSRDGKELFYRNGDKMMAVAVTTRPTFRASKPQVLWEGHYSQGMGSSCGMPGAASANYDVTADGRRFLMIKDLDQDAVSARVVVVMNFAEELKRLTADGKAK